MTIPGLLDGFGKGYTADVPDGGGNAAQAAFGGTIKITANDTPVVITGSFTNGNTGEAGVSVQATQYVYVKQFKNGQPTSDRMGSGSPGRAAGRHGTMPG